MINEELINKIKELGFEVTPDFRGDLKVFSEDIPTEEIIKNIFPLLTIDEEIFFWSDIDRGGIDPGCYYSVYPAGDGMVYNLGNHGWSSGYKRATMDAMAHIIVMNWDKYYDARTQEFRNYIMIKKNMLPNGEKNRLLKVK